MAIGAIQRRQGKWTESNANFEKDCALDPKNVGFMYNLGFSYVAQGNFETADKIFDRALAVSPQSFSARAWKRLKNFSYSFTITGVPSGLASKKCSAIPLGKRMQPCDAAYGGT